MNPFLGVAMPHYSAPDALVLTLKSLETLYGDPPPVFVCDDGSPERPGWHYRGALHVEHLPTKAFALNPCVPINRAVHAAAEVCDLVALTNPGTVFEFDMLERLLATIRSPDWYALAACQSADTGQWLCHSSVRGGEFGRGPMPRGSGFHFLAVFHRDLWRKAGGFDEDYREGQAYEDNDWLWRLEAAGAKFAICDDVVVYNRRSSTRWPDGGLERNRRLLEDRWAHRWLNA